MNKKDIYLLLVFLLSSLPGSTVQAKDHSTRMVDDAVAIMYINNAVLTPEEELEDDLEISGLAAPATSILQEIDTNPLLARFIHSKKMERNDLDANCKLLTSQLQAEGRDCEADRVLSYCQTRRSEINSQIGFYHKMRGDQRKLFTRIWHNIKRNSSNFWYRIGPIGRNFLRNLGDESWQIVVSGGTLSGSTLKNLIKHSAKTLGRQRIKEIVYKGVQRLLQGQIEIAQAAGVKICDSDNESGESAPSQSQETSGEKQVSSFSGSWTCGSDSGYLGAWMQGGDPNTQIEEAELVFDLVSDTTGVSFDISFHGIVQIAMYGASGTSLYYQKAEDFISGTGQAEWVESYFFGTVTMNRIETLFGLDENSDNSVYDDTFSHTAIGGFSPEFNEIHVCFHDHTREQFESIMKQPFDQLLANCSSKNYFVCKPR